MREISGVNQPQVYIDLQGNFWDSQADQLIQHFKNLKAEGITRVALLINSPGGETEPAHRAFDAIAPLGITIHTHNAKSVHSSAHIPYQLGSRRSASKDSYFMLHGITFPVLGSQKKMAAINSLIANSSSLELLQSKQYLESHQSKFDSFMIQRTGLLQADLDTINSKVEDTYLTPQEALRFRITDVICELMPPPGSRIIYVK